MTKLLSVSLVFCLVACGGEEFLPGAETLGTPGPGGVAGAPQGGSPSGGRPAGGETAAGGLPEAGSSGASGGAGSASGGAPLGGMVGGGAGGELTGGTTASGGATGPEPLVFRSFDQKVAIPAGKSPVLVAVVPPAGYPLTTVILRCSPDRPASARLTLGAFTVAVTDSLSVVWPGVPLAGGAGTVETDAALLCSIGY